MAVFQLADRIKETSTIVGTGTATLLGAETGFRSFSTFADGDTVYYVIEAVDGMQQPTGQWETGVGTVGGVGTTLARTTPKQGSSGVATLVNFAAGTKNVFVDEIASASMQANSSDTQVLFNNAGVFGGDAGFTHNSAVPYTLFSTTFASTQFLNIRSTSTVAAIGGNPLNGVGLFVHQTVNVAAPKAGASNYSAIEVQQFVVGPNEVDHVRALSFTVSMNDATATVDDLLGISGYVSKGAGVYNQHLAGGAFTASDSATGLYMPAYMGVIEVGGSAMWMLTSNLNGDYPSFYGAGTLPLAGGVHVPTIVNDGAGTITKIVGLKIENQTAAVTNYAIETGTGLISFNGNLLTLAGALTTSGANALTLTTTGATNVTLPTSGTLATTTGLASYLPLVGGTLTPAVGTSALTVAGVTQTASFPVLDLSQTWNNAGVTFTLIKGNVTSTASAAASLLLDLQVATVSQFSVSKTGDILAVSGNAKFNSLRSNAIGTTEFSLNYYDGGLLMGATSVVGWGSAAAGSGDTYIKRGGAAATVQMGRDVNGSPVPQTFKAHDGITGTDIAGAPLILGSGRGTGAGTISYLAFHTPTVLGSGTTAQSLTERVRIDSSGIKATGYLSSDGTAGATGGPWTSVTFKNGLAVSGS